MTAPLPTAAFCRTCGYALAGLAEPRCPECGRAFNPADPRTFDRESHDRKRRRRAKAVLILVLIGLALAVVAPREQLTVTISYYTGPTTPQERITHWRLLPPTWLDFVPYPRWTALGQGQGLAEAAAAEGGSSFNGLPTLVVLTQRKPLLGAGGNGPITEVSWNPGSDVDPSLRGSLTRVQAEKVLAQKVKEALPVKAPGS